jgi:hypothetical protein
LTFLVLRIYGNVSKTDLLTSPLNFSGERGGKGKTNNLRFQIFLKNIFEEKREKEEKRVEERDETS